MMFTPILGDLRGSAHSGMSSELRAVSGMCLASLSGAGQWWYHPRHLRRGKPWAGRLGLHRSSPKFSASSWPRGTMLSPAGAANQFFLWLSQDWSLPLLHAVGFVGFPPFQVPLGAGHPPNPHAAAAWEHPVNTKKGFFLQREGGIPRRNPTLLPREGWVPT